MAKTLRAVLVVVGLSLIPTLLIWLPFFLRLESFWNIPLPKGGMATIVANYDGPLYMVVAKTFYHPELIKQSFSFALPVEYYAAHFPLFPLLIRAVALVVNYPYAMLLVTLFSSILTIFFFYKFIQKYVDDLKQALFLTSIFAIFPARWLIVRSVGSPEPLFLAAVIASIHFFQEKKYWQAGIWGAIAQATKSVGILLFVAYLGVIVIPNLNLAISKIKNWQKHINFRAYPIFLIPLSLLSVFVIYKIKLNDFLAYFHSGDNIHLFFPPFQIFNYSADWVGTFWLEEIIFIYLLGVLGLLYLIKQKKIVLAWFVGIFFATTIFVSHRDLMRYSLPLVPFIMAAFPRYLVKKEFTLAFLFILIPIYLFSLAYISQNVMPISDWNPLL
jgi:Gpi18-like mannosyltransferase